MLTLLLKLTALCFIILGVSRENNLTHHHRLPESVSPPVPFVSYQFPVHFVLFPFLALQSINKLVIPHKYSHPSIYV